MIKVMVADDNADYNKLCCDFLTNDKNINVISSALDGEETIEKYFDSRPDILLLDLNLPKKNGIEIIDEICKHTGEKKECNIIIISGDNSLRFNLLITSKIFRILPKPASLDLILSTIKELNEEECEIYDNDIVDLLISLNFNLFSDGTHYLVESIKLANQHPVFLKNIKDIYEIIAKRHNIEPNNVKWCIRNSMDTMQKNMEEETIYKMLDSNNLNRKLTPKIFIPLVLNYLNRS